MVFSSLLFLYAFLPLCLLAYSLARKIRYKNWILLVFSLFFYAWGEPFWIIQMLLSGTLVYAMGRLLASCEPKRDRVLKKGFFILGVIIALLPLFVFKYADFFIRNINSLFHTELPGADFSLPLGISFYTFQILTYLIDLYRGQCSVQKRLDDFLLYEAFFPQLIAGPIVRYTDIASALVDRKASFHEKASGARRFVAGLAKKCLIANVAGELVQNSIGSDRLGQLAGLEALLGLFAFALQIYYDFSAYSDMAIGLGQIFGFHFPENFLYPYCSRTIQEFWRRWHISLGTFFRDYVYIPLGGNRRHAFFNLFITWFLTGFWHGAEWNFIFWGLYFLAFLLLEKIFLAKKLARAPRFVSYLYMVPVILLGWAIFYFPSLPQLGLFFRRLFCLDGPFLNLESSLLFKQNVFFLALAALGSLPVWPWLKKKLWGSRPALVIRSQSSYLALSVMAILLGLLLSTAALVGDSYNPFLYFRF